MKQTQAMTQTESKKIRIVGKTEKNGYCTSDDRRLNSKNNGCKSECAAVGEQRNTCKP
jgi:hypothetical protein